MGCKKDQRPPTISDSSINYEEIGMKYAMTTQAELGQHLVGNIQEKGTMAALEFCNAQAYPLTDSMSVVHNAKIKRVSDKPRNPNNQANQEELQYLRDFKNQVAAGKEINPILKTETDKVHFYLPILTNNMCIQCHGKADEQITLEVMSKIDQLYPTDKAKGYDVSQVRGMWSIVFDRIAED